VTGFALVGHAHEVAHHSGLSLRLRFDDLPLLPGAERYARARHLSGGGGRNQEYYFPFVEFRRSLEMWQLALLFDPQTSGPLFAAVDPSAADRVLAAFRAASEPVWVVGEAVEGPAGRIEIT